jgi:hypothetical protein
MAEAREAVTDSQSLPDDLMMTSRKPRGSRLDWPPKRNRDYGGSKNPL